jgi:hypothetical protein
MEALVACARDARSRGLPLRFRVVGHLAWPVDGEALPLSFTGEYAEGMLPALIEQERADAVFFPAQWPETWSYTLTTAIASGLPIVATSLGAFPERLQGVARARVLAWDSPAAAFNDALLAMAGGPPAPAVPVAEGGAADYALRLLEGVPARPGDPAACLAFPAGTATAPGEPLPRATLVELFDDGVRSGNGRSSAELRERLPEADRALAAAAADRERAARAEEEAARTREREAVLEREASALRSEADRLADRVAALESSTSWRLTAPLRALARLLRR